MCDEIHRKTGTKDKIYIFLKNEEDVTLLEITTTAADNNAKIIVIGVGGAGNNAVNRMIDENIGGV